MNNSNQSLNSGPAWMLFDWNEMSNDNSSCRLCPFVSNLAESSPCTLQQPVFDYKTLSSPLLLPSASLSVRLLLKKHVNILLMHNGKQTNLDFSSVTAWCFGVMKSWHIIFTIPVPSVWMRTCEYGSSSCVLMLLIFPFVCMFCPTICLLAIYLKYLLNIKHQIGHCCIRLFSLLPSKSKGPCFCATRTTSTRKPWRPSTLHLFFHCHFFTSFW